MASETSASLVLFIAAIAAAGIAGGVLAGVINDMAGELRDRGNAMANAVGTDLAIVNDPDNVPYDATNDELTIYVKNTGTTELDEEDLLVLVNGQHATFNSTLLDGATSWREQTVVELTVAADLATGDHRVRVSYETVGDNLQFRV